MANEVNIKNYIPIEYSATPIIDTSTYASGDLVGTLMTFENVFNRIKEARVVGVRILDLAKQNAELDLVLFTSNPTNTTFTDNVILDVNDNDLEFVVPIPITEYSSFSDNSLAYNFLIDIPINCSSFDTDHNLYACLVARSGATYISSSDIKVYLSVIEI